jgi:cytosine/adenosine deaminase-related metal-dependent hydrolase
LGLSDGSTVTRAFAWKARYVFPVDRPPIPDGIVTVADDRIVAVGENASGRAPHDLGNVAILPGLINAHTHLEFSDLLHPLGEPSQPFTDWIRAVVAWRRAQNPTGEEELQRRTQAVARGLEECRRCGTAAVGDIATPGGPVHALQSARLDCTVFLELLGLGADRVEPLMRLAYNHVEAAPRDRAGWRPGLSPHAPYTVHPELLAQAVAFSRQTGFPVAMHVAESLAELELLQSASGPFVELLKSLDAWQPDAIPRSTRPLDYLRILSQAHRSLVIHGNYLASDEVGFLANHSDRMSVVYCPRTHAFFGHRPFPLADMLARGVNVALGTDSRASNPDLSLLGEMRHVYRQHADVAPRDILRLGTVHGAVALGLQDELGSLTPGKLGNFAIVELPPHEAADPHELLLGIASR